jgi:hypothetical protein
MNTYLITLSNNFIFMAEYSGESAAAEAKSPGHGGAE